MNPSYRSQKVQAACISERGKVRKTNQDSFLIDPDLNLFIVSDGLGGHLAGDVASKVVVTVLPELIKHRLASFASARSRIVELGLREAVLELSRQLRDESKGKAGLQGMGATLAMIFLRPDRSEAQLVHSGDSRIYLMRNMALSLMTEDHSVVSLLLKLGEITQDEAKQPPARGRLSRYIGIEGEVYPDVNTVRLQKGDQFLICSDGLTGMVSDEDIARVLKENPEPESTCSALVSAANDAGGEDNITAMVIIWS